MPVQTQSIKRRVGKLIDSVESYGANVVNCSRRAGGKWSRIARENPDSGDFEYFNPDLRIGMWMVVCPARRGVRQRVGDVVGRL